MDKNLNYFDIVPIINSFYIKVDKSLLYDEISGFNKEFSELDSDIIKISNDMLWPKMLEKRKYPNLYKIVECVLAIPVSNAFVERVFSMMKNLWLDERNSLSVGLMNKSYAKEICTKVNFNMKCHEFSEFIAKNKSLLSAAKSNSKYIFN